MLYRAMYVSRAKATDAQGFEADLAAILAAARRHNRQQGLTGLLLVHRPWFLQVLEGQRPAISQTLMRILSDDRHRDVELVEVLPVVRRHFARWDMDVRHLRDEDDLLAQFTVGAVFDPTALDAASLHELLILAAQSDGP